MARGKSKKGSFLQGILRFLTTSPVWQILLIALVVVIIIWQQEPLLKWAESVTRLFGWGLFFVLIAAILFTWMLWRQKLYLVPRYWNRWLGAFILMLSVWGIFAFITPGGDILGSISLGGKIGRGIIAFTDLEGILRIIGLAIIGIVVMAPGTCRRFIQNSYSWFIRQFKQPGYRRTEMPEETPFYSAEPREPRQPFSKELEGTPMASVDLSKLEAAAKAIEAMRPPEEGGTSGTALERKKPRPVTPIENETPPDLKQVAQDVWRKYGESPDLVVVDGWRLPPIDILDHAPEVKFSQADNAEKARLIEDALGSYGVEAKVVQINEGPTVTQFGVEPGWDRKFKDVREKDKDGNTVVKQEEVSKTRVKVDRITSLQNDMALALAAPSIRIEAPVPGKSMVGLEVPNSISTMVSLRGVIETGPFQKLQGKSKLALALGKGAGGEAISGDLAKMPHLLIAGSTGSGKTVCLNALICCLILNNTPDDVRFIMIDPKRVELTTFNTIPHLAAPVIVDSDKAVDALHWLAQEMNTRYKTMATVGARNIESFNKKRSGDDRMSYLVLVIDELADLMMLGGDEVETILCRLAQLSRAVGIHLVVATQRPSVDVVTGLIKANFPTRISFAVTSQVDSRTILDSVGAEKLLGSGDMLYLPTDAGKPKRLQGCYVSDAEAERLVYFWGTQNKENNHILKIEDLKSVSSGRGGQEEDSLMDAARELADEHTNISTSFLQRRLRIGYPRAARIMEAIEQEMSGGGKEEDFDADPDNLEDDR
ncbi:DNA translocase FtsK 4TM domain-containing protein [Chloroflexota bacterium]